MRATFGWILAVAALAVPGLAAAGGMITDGKTSYSATSSSTTTTVLVAVQTCPTTGCPVVNTGNGTTTTVGSGGAITLTPYDLKQIQDGVVTSSEAQTGCSAGSSPAAAFPLLLVGLALLAARRRR